MSGMVPKLRRLVSLRSDEAMFVMRLLGLWVAVDVWDPFDWSCEVVVR